MDKKIPLNLFKMTETKIKNSKMLKKYVWIFLLIFLCFSLGFLLSFHILIGYNKIIPKEHLTFNNTFVTNNDIVNLIERYNRADFFEKQAIINEPLYRRLTEEGLIYNTEDESDNNNVNSIEGTTWQFPDSYSVTFLKNGQIKLSDSESGGKWKQNGKLVTFDTNGYTIFKMEINGEEMIGTWERIKGEDKGLIINSRMIKIE